MTASSQTVQPATASSKSMRFPFWPGKGSTVTRCVVKATHFFVELLDKDLHLVQCELSFHTLSIVRLTV